MEVTIKHVTENTFDDLTPGNDPLKTTLIIKKLTVKLVMNMTKKIQSWNLLIKTR